MTIGLTAVLNFANDEAFKQKVSDEVFSGKKKICSVRFIGSVENMEEDTDFSRLSQRHLLVLMLLVSELQPSKLQMESTTLSMEQKSGSQMYVSTLLYSFGRLKSLKILSREKLTRSI